MLALVILKKTNMNLNSYDIVNPSFEKGTWINPDYKRLYSTEISYAPKCIFLSRYDKETNNYIYYIGMCKTPQVNALNVNVEKDKNNRIKIYLDSIWNKSDLRNITKTSFISVDLIEKDDDMEIYRLNI